MVIVAHEIVVDFVIIFVKSFMSDFTSIYKVMSFGSWAACGHVKIVVSFAYFIVAFAGSLVTSDFDSVMICETDCAVTVADLVASCLRFKI